MKTRQNSATAAPGTAHADAPSDLPPGCHLIGCGSRPATAAAVFATDVGLKAWNLLRMTGLNLPVPPAFVLGTAYSANPANPARASRPDVWLPCLRKVEQATGKRFGDPRVPLLVSVRSGAPVSMPGMMETMLNVGLCDATVAGLTRQTGNPRLVWDAYRRLVASYGEVIAGLPATDFSSATTELFPGRDERELDFAELRALTCSYLRVFAEGAGRAFPQDPHEQLSSAIEAVLASWQSARAREYRRLHNIDDALGTAVTVQAMVFGNGGGRSGSGVGFTRDPTTGEPGLWVDFLFNAQGEDVVSGRRNAHGHERLAEVLPAAWAHLQQAAAALESMTADMQDFEFTVQAGRLFMLQTRSGRRTPRAAARIALDLWEEGLIDRNEAERRIGNISPSSLALTRVVSIDGMPLAPIGHAATASSGVATGEIALDGQCAEKRHQAGAAVILVRRDAETRDIVTLDVAGGLLTQRGARTSHAAVVARQMGKVCLVGCTAMSIDETRRSVSFGETVLKEGDVLTLDGNDGRIYIGAVQTREENDPVLAARLRRFHEHQDATCGVPP